ncbi:MAG: hypothetical protein JXR37_14890 [Kiritimatiellae bacterium]|nr:hypothetical protein [Kiritimatiellia bacterium]
MTNPTFKIPRIETPRFWLSNFGKVQAYLHTKLARGRLERIGFSSLSYPIHAVEYANKGKTPLMVVGGTHGHEPGGVAAVMNLVNLMERGVDLDGWPHPELCRLLDQVHLHLIPILNPDGRVVCPDSFYGLPTEAVKVYSCGLKKDGSLIPYEAGSDDPLYYFDPNDAIFMGGQFNGAGYAINRRTSPDDFSAVEVRHLVEYLKGRGVQGLFDLHACGSNIAVMPRSHEPPYWPIAREWQKRAEALFESKSRPLSPMHGDGDPPKPLTHHFNSSVVHKHAQLFWLACEGRQGYAGHPNFMPIPTEWEIIDDYLAEIAVFLELGIEGLYAKANQAVFGPKRQAAGAKRGRTKR